MLRETATSQQVRRDQRTVEDRWQFVHLIQQISAVKEKSLAIADAALFPAAAMPIYGNRRTGSASNETVDLQVDSTDNIDC